MPRAYTKSGSVEKYESGQWSTPVWSGGATGSITGPDSNGNYTVNAPSGYVAKDVSPTVTCVTKYGGVSKTFGFGYTDISISFTGAIISLRKGVREDKSTTFHLSIPNNCKATLSTKTYKNADVSISITSTSSPETPNINIEVGCLGNGNGETIYITIEATCTGGTEYPIGATNSIQARVANIR